MRKFQRYVLLDRDGVINEAVRDGYVTDAGQVRLIAGAARAIAELNAAGFGVVCVSNQQCVGKGIIDAAQLEHITEHLRALVRNESGGVIEEILYCTHLASAGCDCRKPKPGLLHAARDQFGFALEDVVLVGDSYSDIETARNAGCRAIFVLSGLDVRQYEAGEAFPYPPVGVAKDLGDAVRFILGSICGHGRTRTDTDEHGQR